MYLSWCQPSWFHYAGPVSWEHPWPAEHPTWRFSHLLLRRQVGTHPWWTKPPRWPRVCVPSARGWRSHSWGPVSESWHFEMRRREGNVEWPPMTCHGLTPGRGTHTHQPPGIKSGGLACNIGYPSATHLKPKSYEILSACNLLLNDPIVLKFCTEHGNDTDMLYAKFQK